MKLFIRTVIGAALLTQFSTFVSAQSMLSGTFPGASENLLGTRFRNVRNVNANQNQGIFTGIPDLGSNRGNGSRSDATMNYGSSGSFSFTIRYNVAANTLTTVIRNAGNQTFTSTLTNVTDRLTEDNKTNSPVTINLMRLTVRTQNSASSITVSNLNIDGTTIQGSFARTNSSGLSEWFLTSNLLRNGFVVTGDVNATGNFANSAEGNRVELSFAFTPTPNAALLPVSWGEIAARATATGNRISWNTLQETNTSHFDVQRSVDGVRFTTVGTVAAAGQSDRSISYQFEDRTAQAGTAYYRLLQVDKDGRQSFSTVVKVQAAAGAATRVAVTGNNVRMSFSAAADRTIAVVDMNGRLIRQVRSADAVVNLNVNELNNGMYVLVVNAPGQQQETHRFVK